MVTFVSQKKVGTRALDHKAPYSGCRELRPIPGSPDWS